MPGAEDVIAFWFSPESRRRWYAKDPEFDEAVRDRLGHHHDVAAHGAYDDWLNTPHGSLAVCILLDQVPRNIFRDSKRAFATDGAALEAARRTIDAGLDTALARDERSFIYLPFEHSENLADQRRALELMATLSEQLAHYARLHHDIIARFGRFPHRNAVLGRTSTPEEEAFLEEPGSSF